MIQIKNTPQLAGITIKGDYQDLQELHRAISDYSSFYFQHQENVNAGHCHECILGLCYDLRHAFQGDRNFEGMENNADRIAGMIGIITKPRKGEMELIEAARSAFGNGNLYFSVDVLYPWALYYAQTLYAITDIPYSKSWFEDTEFPYDEYRAEKDAALIHYFVLLIREAVREELPPQYINTINKYFSLFSEADFYMSYPDLYIEWLCNWWVSTASNREERRFLLPLLCLELTSINEEDEEELRDELEDIIAAQQSNAAAGNSENEHLLNFEKMLKELKLSCIQIYDTHYAKAVSEYHISYKSMDEYMDDIHEHVKAHGPFYTDTYEDYLDKIFGSVDWDGLEW
ncbi:MAG: hypothetical protein Q4D81_15080 [Eubacteriales bacterium]|nr:hypothetical protein [Eubacteriales bacterium]